MTQSKIEVFESTMAFHASSSYLFAIPDGNTVIATSPISGRHRVVTIMTRNSFGATLSVMEKLLDFPADSDVMPPALFTFAILL